MWLTFLSHREALQLQLWISIYTHFNCEWKLTAAVVLCKGARHKPSRATFLEFQWSAPLNILHYNAYLFLISYLHYSGEAGDSRSDTFPLCKASLWSSIICFSLLSGIVENILINIVQPVCPSSMLSFFAQILNTKKGKIQKEAQRPISTPTVTEKRP